MWFGIRFEGDQGTELTQSQSATSIRDLAQQVKAAGGLWQYFDRHAPNHNLDREIFEEASIDPIVELLVLERVLGELVEKVNLLDRVKTDSQRGQS
jgi:hypothetical protein